MADTLQINRIFSFNTASPVFLSSRIEAAKLIAIMSADQARKEFELDTQYKNILPTLPDGTPASADNCVVYKFTSMAGTPIYMADAWIVMDSVEIVQYVPVTVKLTKTSSGDVSKIRDILNAAGYTDFSVQTDL